jgi:hypothetical protein
LFFFFESVSQSGFWLGLALQLCLVEFDFSEEIPQIWMDGWMLGMRGFYS